MEEEKEKTEQVGREKKEKEGGETGKELVKKGVKMTRERMEVYKYFL
jgi:Fe2+ or Zn2+ uptake regulation protein